MANEPDYKVDMPWSGANTPIQPENKLKANKDITNIINKSMSHKNIDAKLYGIDDQHSNDTTEQKVLKKYKPRMKYDMEVGDNQMLPIAIGLPNRIKTNFKEIEVIGNFPENVYISQDGGFMTIAVNSSDAVGLFIREFEMPETEIAITLFPFNVGQAMIDLNINMPKSMTREAERRREQRKKDSEISLSLSLLSKENKHNKEYINKYSEILEAVANAEDPKGFTLQNTSPKQPCPQLNKIGINHTQLQSYSSARQTIDIIHIKNLSGATLDFNEEYCMFTTEKEGQQLNNEIVVVGVYPRSTLHPDDEAEVYIIRNNKIQTLQKKQRKRLIAE
jgi:conjugal transfer pilus assembly protein TraK